MGCHQGKASPAAAPARQRISAKHVPHHQGKASPSVPSAPKTLLEAGSRPGTLSDEQTVLKLATAQHWSRPAETSSQGATHETDATHEAKVAEMPLMETVVMPLVETVVSKVTDATHGESSHAELANRGDDAEQANTPPRRQVTFGEEEAIVISRAVTVESDFEFVDCRKAGAGKVTASDAVSDNSPDTNKEEEAEERCLTNEPGKALLALELPMRRPRQLACC